MACTILVLKQHTVDWDKRFFLSSTVYTPSVLTCDFQYKHRKFSNFICIGSAFWYIGCSYVRFTTTSDIWALGITFWELWTDGQRPFADYTSSGGLWQDILDRITRFVSPFFFCFCFLTCTTFAVSCRKKILCKE